MSAKKTHNVALWKTSELDEEFVFGQAADGVRCGVGEMKDVSANGGEMFHRLSTALLSQPEPLQRDKSPR